MFGCCGDCQNSEAMQSLPSQLMGASNESLNFYIQGVRTGLAIRAADQAKWQRVGVMLALTFGFITFIKHFGE